MIYNNFSRDRELLLFSEAQNQMMRGKTDEFEEKGSDGILRGYRWVNQIPLNKSHPDLEVNFLDYWEIREGKEFNFSWITEGPLTAKNVLLIMKGEESRV